MASPGENLEGTVPARALLVGVCDVFSVGGMKSGNPSWLGDSGIVSRKGVDPPLAGGPQRLGVVKPSCAWISRALVKQERVSKLDIIAMLTTLTALCTIDFRAHEKGNRPRVASYCWYRS